MKNKIAIDLFNVSSIYILFKISYLYYTCRVERSRDLILKALQNNNLSTPRPNGPLGTGRRSRRP